MGNAGATVQFYDVATRSHVEVPLSAIVKRQYSPQGKPATYALRAVVEGRTLQKFVSKAQYDESPAPEG